MNTCEIAKAVLKLNFGLQNIPFIPSLKIPPKWIKASYTTYILKNCRMHWGERVPIVKLERQQQNSPSNWSYKISGIHWLPSSWYLRITIWTYWVSIKGPSSIIQEWNWHHTLVQPQNEVELSGFSITVHVKMAELGLSIFQDNTSLETSFHKWNNELHDNIPGAYKTIFCGCYRQRYL